MLYGNCYERVERVESMIIDPTYLLFVMLPGLILSAWAQSKVYGAYEKWKKIENSRKLTGADVARTFQHNYGFNVSLESAANEKLSDHFEPSTGIVRLSPEVAQLASVASMSISAHEFGHVQQYAQGSVLIKARSFILPVAKYGSNFAYIMILIGLIMQFAGLAWLGLGIFFFTTLFAVLTLPIELDASRRALKMLEENGMVVSQDDRSGAQAVLRAAAYTYLASMIVAILNFTYYAMVVSGMNRDE